MYKTQKMRGMLSRFDISEAFGHCYSVPPILGVLPYSPIGKPWPYPIFARPCPEKPRHGFVESQPVNSKKGLESILKKTLAADPNAEVMLMKPLTAKWSAVITAGGVTFASGNDGVTGGKGEAFTLEAPGAEFDNVMNAFSVERRDNEGWYLEIVEHQGYPALVQFRTGPKLASPAAEIWLPKMNVEVCCVLEPTSSDLMKWETAIIEESIKDRRSKEAHPVAYLPGHTLSSHFAVQAMAAGLGVVVGGPKPELNSVLAMADKALATEHMDFTDLKVIIAKELGRTYQNEPSDVVLSVAVLHSLPYWPVKPPFTKIVVQAAHIALAYVTAAVTAESRHGNGTAADWRKIGVSKSKHSSRDLVYEMVLNLGFDQMLEWLEAIEKDLSEWGGVPSAKSLLAEGKSPMAYRQSFGGPRWEYACILAQDLHRAIGALASEPSQDKWLAMIGAYNKIVNMVHNGAYVLSKWIPANYIEMAARAPAAVLAHKYVASVIMDTPCSSRDPFMFGSTVVTGGAPKLPGYKLKDGCIHQFSFSKPVKGHSSNQGMANHTD